MTLIQVVFAVYIATLVLLVIMYAIKFTGWLLRTLWQAVGRPASAKPQPKPQSEPQPKPRPQPKPQARPAAAEQAEAAPKSAQTPVNEAERHYDLEINDDQLQRIVAAQTRDTSATPSWRRLQPKSKSVGAYDSFYKHIRDAGDQDSIGKLGESLLEHELKHLQRKGKIRWYQSTENMLVGNRDFEIDFLAKLPDGNLIVIETKLYAGSVYCNNQDTWLQKNKDQDKLIGNAAGQVNRAMTLTRQILNDAGLDYFLIPLVVMTHPQATVYLAEGPQAPQCDVILLEDLERWLYARNPSGFEAVDLANIRAVFAAAA